MHKQVRFVLLVDDDPSDRKLFARFLEKLGVKVVSTGDPDRAMQLIVEGNVGCLITDQKMQPSGHELVRIVKSIRSDIGMILLSGADRPSEPLPPEILFINKRDKESLAQRFWSA